MAACSDRALNGTSHLKNSSNYHFTNTDSPLSSTMGSVSSLLNDSGYRGGSSTNHNDTTNTSNDKDGSHVYEDLEIGPPPITPISGRLEKHNEKRLIKPIAVRPITPNGAPSGRGAATPDNIADLPRVPDVVSGAQNHRDHHASAGSNHFAPARPYPIKSLSLQDIKFMNGGGKRTSISSVHQLCELKPSLKRAPISQSLNQLNFNHLYNSHQNGGGHRPPDYRRISRTSQSSYNCDYRHHPAKSMQDSRRHSNASLSSSSQAVDYRAVNHYDDSLSHGSSHLSSGVVMEEEEMESIYELKQKIQEHESQITLLRQTMEQNEQIIFKVYEEKQQIWDDDMDELKDDLKHAEDKMYKMEQIMRRQIYQLEQDKKRMLKEIEKLRHERDILHRKLGAHKEERTSFMNQIEEAKWKVCQKSGEISLLKTQLKESKSEISRKMNEVLKLKSQLKDSKIVVDEKENEVCLLKDRLSQKEHSSVESGAHPNSDGSATEMNSVVEQLHVKLCQKENELSAEKFEVLQLQEVRDGLEKRLKGKEKELVALSADASKKANDLGQSSCEISYLHEVQEKLSQQICEKNNEIVNLQDSLKQLRENDEEITAIKRKLLQREREVITCEEKLAQIEAEKDSEVSTLQRRLSQKECEISTVQSKCNHIEREKLLMQAKVARLKDNNNVGTQKQMEQDMVKLQVQVTKQERLLLEQNSEMSLLKQKHQNETKGMQSKLSNQERDSSKWYEKVIQREGEIKNIREKLNGKENELARLKGKLSQHESHEMTIQSQNLALKRDIGNLKEEIETLRSEKVTLEVQLQKARAENVTVVQRFEKVTNEVRSLKNQLDAPLHNGLISQSDDGKDERKTSVVIDSLQTEMQKLKAELKKTKDLNEEQQLYFEKERDTWQEEKEKVIKYQKQLQLNYIQMFRKNKNLEKEIQHLMVEFERRHLLNEVVDHV